MMSTYQIEKHPLHLGLGATAIVQPEFTGAMDWYAAYGARHGDDGREGRLVSMHRFSGSWDGWEMHPEGDELVLCIAGQITVIQQMPDGENRCLTLGVGEYAINPPGCWHTADIDGEATVIFITAGAGTENRLR